MNCYLGYIFTEGPIIDLESRGFVLQKDNSNLQHGFRSFFLALGDSECIELREILDEDIYLRKYQLKYFEPTRLNMESRDLLMSDFEFHKAIYKGDINSPDLSRYFAIRKEFPLWAIFVKNRNYDEFKKNVRADKIINDFGSEALLVHLGPNCFDIIVQKRF